MQSKAINEKNYNKEREAAIKTRTGSIVSENSLN